MENPLTISIATSPFMSINSAIAKQFASQSLEKVKAKILSSKLKAQQQIQQQYGELEETIAEYYHNSEVSSTPKNI